MAALEDRWVSSFSFLLFCAVSIPILGSASLVQELSPHEYFSGLQANKASLAYFSRTVSPGVQLFLEQIENSVEALHDYGISVVKAGLKRSSVPKRMSQDTVEKRMH